MDTELDRKREQAQFMDAVEGNRAEVHSSSAFWGWMAAKMTAKGEANRLAQVHQDLQEELKQVRIERNRLQQEAQADELLKKDGQCFQAMAILLGEGGTFYPQFGVRLMELLVNHQTGQHFENRHQMVSEFRHLIAQVRNEIDAKFEVGGDLPIPFAR